MKARRIEVDAEVLHSNRRETEFPRAACLHARTPPATSEEPRLSPRPSRGHEDGSCPLRQASRGGYSPPLLRLHKWVLEISRLLRSYVCLPHGARVLTADPNRAIPPAAQTPKRRQRGARGTRTLTYALQAH